MTDMIDLQSLKIIRSPQVALWPATLAITAIDMDPRGGLTLHFDRPVPESWKFRPPEFERDDNVQFTVWAIAEGTYAAGFVPMWQGRAMGDRALPPILSGFADWWGDPRRLWEGMSYYVPKPGDTVGFFVTAGNARLVTHQTSVAERSNVVAVTLPADDRGRFLFEGPLPPAPAPDPPTNDAQVERLISAVEHQAIATEQNTRAVDALATRLDVLRQNGIRVRI